MRNQETAPRRRAQSQAPADHDPWFTSVSRAAFRLVEIAGEWRRRRAAPELSFPVLVSHPTGEAGVLERAMVHSVVIETDRYTVGRDDGNDLTVDEPTVSRRHAALVRGADPALALVDTGSANGTFLDGVALAPGEAVPVATGLAVIRFGPRARFALMDEASFDAFVQSVPEVRRAGDSETRRASRPGPARCSRGHGECT